MSGRLLFHVPEMASREWKPGMDKQKKKKTKYLDFLMFLKLQYVIQFATGHLHHGQQQKLHNNMILLPPFKFCSRFWHAAKAANIAFIALMAINSFVAP